jgi:hypothetical protein
VDIDGSPHSTRSSFTIAAAPSIADEVLLLVQKAVPSTSHKTSNGEE